MRHAMQEDGVTTAMATWLLSALESHWSSERIQTDMVATFDVTDEEARKAECSARSAILAAISGSPKNRPDSETDSIGYATFNLVWNTFNQNSFFDKRRTPTSKWLHWKSRADKAG